MVVSRADVAKMAGVSPALVSYVTNNGPRSVSPEARARIEHAIETLGYTPNTIAQALRGSATQTIALLLPTAVNSFFGELATAIERELFDTGNSLAVGITDDDPDREIRYIETFRARQVDGIMVISSNSQRTLNRLGEEGTPTIVLDRVPGDFHLPSAEVDNRHGVQAAIEHLLGHGHERIGCVGGRAGTDSADERVRAWRELRPGGANGDKDLARCDFTEAGGYGAAILLLSRDGIALPAGERPTALFVSSDVQAAGVIRACYDLDLSVPNDVAIVSFDGTMTGSFAVPSLTSYRQPIAELARLAVAGLLARIADPLGPVTHEVAQGELVLGGSCGCAVDSGKLRAIAAQ